MLPVVILNSFEHVKRHRDSLEVKIDQPGYEQRTFMNDKVYKTMRKRRMLPLFLQNILILYSVQVAWLLLG